MFDASVKWELTAWPLMDMANVAVSHLVAGPRDEVLWDRVWRFVEPTTDLYRTRSTWFCDQQHTC